MFMLRVNVGREITACLVKARLCQIKFFWFLGAVYNLLAHLIGIYC